MDVLKGIELNEARFLTLLEKLIGNAEKVQNMPPEHVPHEAIMVDFVMEVLAPVTVCDKLAHENGGPLKVWKCEYVEGRPNLCITYQGRSDRVLSLVGAHLDVVPADPATWERDPFTLIRDGDKLYGRGTTDCLGHVALITTLMTQIAEERPDLETTIHVIFIASEEYWSAGVGVDEMMKRGDCHHVLGGPVLWVDCADSSPCLGTAGSTCWTMSAKGKLFHSGFPNKTVNAVELCIDAVGEMQKEFYSNYPQHEKEAEYKFVAPSSLKPTQLEGTSNSVNQIPATASIRGDVRLTPFYSMDEMKSKMTQCVANLNGNLNALPGHGPSKYVVDGVDSEVAVEFGNVMKGVYVDMTSPGYAALAEATKTVRGEVKPYSVCGSLPLVGELKEAGMDLQLIGFGLMSTYHGNNEYALLSDMKDGARILAHFIANFEEKGCMATGNTVTRQEP